MSSANVLFYESAKAGFLTWTSPWRDFVGTRSLAWPWLWPHLTFASTWNLSILSFISSLDENQEKQELLIERAQGQYLIDNDGEHYLDLINNVAHGKFSSGFWFGWMVQVIWSVSRLRSHAFFCFKTLGCRQHFNFIIKLILFIFYFKGALRKVLTVSVH